MDLLYPPRCVICDKVVSPGETVCAACRKKIHIVQEPVCMKCGKPLLDAERYPPGIPLCLEKQAIMRKHPPGIPLCLEKQTIMRKQFCGDCEKKKHYFTQGKSLWVYEAEVKKSIYRFKYQNKREYATGYAEEIAKEYGDWIKRKKIQAIVPIPLYKKKQRKRGYNQAQILAKELGRVWNLPVYTDLLIRIRDTKPQKMLNDSERKNNLKKAFKTTKNIVQLEHILLIDDIYTTGSTLDAAAAALLAAGAGTIYTCCISIGKDS